jgi:uncharacterized membrane protein
MGRDRLANVDLVRGVVMVLMALDHTRDYFMIRPYQPTDMDHTTVAFFFTRWLTHFCAPTFVFLAGTGAYLHGARCRTRWELAGFLLTRGLWLVFLELFVVSSFWKLRFDPTLLIGAVVWAIGWSMVVLAVLQFLPVPVVVGFGVLLITGHNALDKITVWDVGPLGGVWAVLHTGDMVRLGPGVQLIPAYPLIPWVGVMAVGYGFGALLQRGREERRWAALVLGIFATAAFVLLRATNWYGDPDPWSVQADPALTVCSFLNCRKYPPSLCYLLMTLGPALIALAALDREPGPVGKFFIVFGRVPLFYYVLHLPLIIALGAVHAIVRYGPDALLWTPETLPNEMGDLVTVYAAWVVVVALLYPVCRWYAGVKQRHRGSVLLSYL